MSTVEKKFVGEVAAEQIVANVKEALNEKQPKGDYALASDIPKGETIYYIEGTGTTAGTWLGSCDDITEYYDGLTIAYKIGVAGASTTTLNINGLGAKTVKRATSNLTTQLGVNAVVHLTYTTIDGVGYWVWANYDSGNTKVTQSQSSTATGKYPVILSYYTQDKTTTTAQTVRRDNNFYYQPSTGTLTVDTVAGNATSADKVNNAITFTGEVTDTYDGSAAKTINIPKSYRAATPQDYGATGSGDDTAAFQSALANNRRVFVPGGNYTLSGELVIRDNCELELAQDAVLYFIQTSGNCISMKQCAHLKGNHATVSVPYAFSGNVINADAGLSTSVTECPPFAKWDPQWKTGRYITNLNIVKPDTRGFYYSMDGSCSGTAVYICTDGSDTSTFMWGVNFSGLRIAGAFSYGIRAVNVGSGYNHEMRIEAVIDACEIGVSLENVNNAYVSAIVQPRAAFTTSEAYVPYAKHGIQLINSRNADLSGSRVWDWNATKSLWVVGGEYQHIAMRGDCSGSILNDFFYYEMPNYDIRSLIYTDTASNLEKINILQEPFTRWFKPIDNKPHFFDGDADQELVEKRTLDTMISFGERPEFTDQLAIAGDGSGGVFNEIGYNRNALWDQDGANLTSSSWVGCTGYIACQAGQVIHVRGMSFVGATDDSRIVIFDSNYTKLRHFNASVIPTATYFLSYAPMDNGFDITVLPNGNCADTAYVKFNVPTATITTNPVIAVNEDVVYTYEGSLSEAIKIQIDQVDGLSEILGSYINDVDALIGGDS